MSATREAIEAKAKARLRQDFPWLKPGEADDLIETVIEPAWSVVEELVERITLERRRTLRARRRLEGARSLVKTLTTFMRANHYFLPSHLEDQVREVTE